MKNLIKLSFAAFCLLLTVSTSYAQGNECQSFKIGMYPVVNTLKMNLLIEKDKGVPLFVTLRDEDNKIIHRQVMSRKSTLVGQKLDFAETEDGNYYLTISDGKNEIVKEIKLNTKQVVEVPSRALVAVN